MNIKDSLKKLSKDTQDILKKIYKLEDNSDISLEEITSFKRAVISLYDDVSEMEWLIKNITEGQQADGEAEAEFEAEQERKAETESELEPEVEAETEQAVEPVPETDIDPDRKEKLVTSARKLEKSASVLSDKFRDNKKYRNEALKKGMPANDLSSKFHDKPIPDIAAAIGINEKFRYIRELFKGDADSYNTTIKHLNKVKADADAVEYFEKKLDFDIEDKLVRMLLDLTRRKLRCTK